MIRPATIDDMPALEIFARAVFAENFGHLYKAEAMELHLQKTCSAAFFAQSLDGIILAIYENRIAGYSKFGAVGLPIDPLPENAAEIHRLYVGAEYQGRGMGDLLMGEALSKLASASLIYIGVWEHNRRAQRFYAKYGFVAVGEYNYYVGDDFDRELILERRC